MLSSRRSAVLRLFPGRAASSPQPGKRPARLQWALALVLALLAAQLQAQLHPLSHLGEWEHGDSEHIAEVCLECLALSSLDVLAGGSTHPPAADSSLPPFGADFHPAPDTPPPPPRCRAPPAPPSFAHFA